MTRKYPPLRIGFVGGHGHHYLAGALRDEFLHVEATAMASDPPGAGDPEAARKRAERFGDAQWFDSPEEMFDRFKPTVVNVGAVYALNGPIARQALERNLPVVCDKPVAATWDDYHALAAVVQGKRLITEFNFRAWACFRAVRQLVRDGRIGTVVLAHAQKSYRFGHARPDFYRDRAAYTSTLLWVASHAIDIIPHVTGRDYTRVVAQHSNVARPDYGSMEDHAVAMFTLNNGGSALVHADFHQPQASRQHGDDRLRVVGSEGILEVRDRRCVLTTHTEPDADVTDQAEEIPIHRALLDAALFGDEDVFSTAQSLATARTLLHARDAADAGRAIDIAKAQNEK